VSALRTIFVGMLLWTLVFAGSASADSKLERKLNLQPGGTFGLDTDVGSVTLTGDSGAGATVTVTSERSDLARRYDVQFHESASGVRVTVKRRGSGWLTDFFGGDWFNGGQVHFLINVPRQTSVTVNTSGGEVRVSRVEGDARVRSSGGGLRLEELEGNVEAHTSGGSIRARRVGGDLRAATSGGGIEIADVTGGVRAETSGGGIRIDGVTGEVYADTSGGGVDVRRAGGRVEAHSSGGPVTVGFAAGNGRGGALSSSGGGVHVELDPKVALSIDADSSGGHVNCDLSVTTRDRSSSGSLRGNINGGGSLLHLRSSGGGVRISGARIS
jgi:hypothetical protein